jgi:hypothetical protein
VGSLEVSADDTGTVIPGAFPNSGMAGERAPNTIRERFAREKDSVIENALGKQESWAKKVQAGQSGVLLDDLPRLLAALGLKVVDRSKVCVDREVYDAYKTLAGKAITEPRKLDWDE